MKINQQKNMNERIEYFDVVKALLIILVVSGHVLIIINPGYDKLYFSAIQAFIYTFHMPAFFIIHGILFNNEKYKKICVKDFIAKRIYSLIIPYLFFEVIGIVWKAIFCKQRLSEGLYYLITIRCNVGADWFLIALFLGSLLFLLYVKYPNRVYGIVSAIVCFVLPMFLSGHQLTIVIGRGMLTYGFIMIGNLGKEWFRSEKTKSVLWLSTSLVITAIVAIISLKWAGNDFYTCTVDNPITLVIGGISGTLLILGISRILHCKMLTSIGNHTLTIMGTHQLVIYAMTVLIPTLYGGSIGGGILLLGAIVLFEIPVVLLIDRYLPFFVGKGYHKR